MQTMDWNKEGASNDFIVYPEGTYKVSINGFEPVTASTGTKQIRWKATIIEPTEYKGKPITVHTALTEKSLWRIARLVKACGIDLEKLPKMEVGSTAFLKVLESCKRRTSFWHAAVVVDNKGRDKNEIDDFKADPDQIAEADWPKDDEPEFLKS